MIVFFKIMLIAIGLSICNSAQSAEEISMQYIYKILTPGEWQEFKTTDSFSGTSLDLIDGFIHASTEEQYPHILEKFFGKIRPVLLLKLNTTYFKDSLKIEANKPGGDLYPHIYSKIRLDAVVDHWVLD